MHKYFAYIRVSTPKQGQQGVSLEQQRDAISRYAERNALTISLWFEERETAAKAGRAVFSEMLQRVCNGEAHGVIIHKIDRSARNLHDWNELGDLVEQGIDIRFANEALDLRSRGGRLSADIQAVVAADYIRNLREETKKGFYGRLKQGLYPMPAPLGYLDAGAGKPKEVDPERAPLLTRAFELYASGGYTHHTLETELFRLGLRTRKGHRVTFRRWADILKNEFYIGIIRIRKNGEAYQGVHRPIISIELFKRVRAVTSGKSNTRPLRHRFLFRRFISCKHCGYNLIGELQKGHVYYRCQSKNCPTTCLREEHIEERFCDELRKVEFSDAERECFQSEFSKLHTTAARDQEQAEATLRLRLAQIAERVDRLTEAYLDGLIERDRFTANKTALLLERREIDEQLMQMSTNPASISRPLQEFLELAGSAYNTYQNAESDEKRELLNIITSNRLVSGTSLEITLDLPFRELAARPRLPDGDPKRSMARTCRELLDRIVPLLRPVTVSTPEELPTVA